LSRASRWALLQHVAHEGPGLIAAEAAARGVELEPAHLWEVEPLPEPGGLGGLVVMGGPMSVNDLDAHAWLAPEIELISGALDAGLPVLGVCLGAQLIARALGAEVVPCGIEEVGFGTVALTQAGAADPVLGPAGPELQVFHWHGETFEPPPACELLASSELYASQAFRAGELAYGLQFHVEVDRDLLAGWRPHLPAGVDSDDRRRAAVERGGGAILGRFFDLAAPG
jgi:GMP synthase-like glutamine amidotransferase